MHILTFDELPSPDDDEFEEEDDLELKSVALLEELRSDMIAVQELKKI